jgi:tetrahydromethanopterin S-methyltransferase subunit H
MAIIIANENGDWWSVDETMTTKLYILDTAKITNPKALLEIAEYAGVEYEYDENDEPIIPADIHKQIDKGIFDSDSLEDLAQDFGIEKTIEL